MLICFLPLLCLLPRRGSVRSYRCSAFIEHLLRAIFRVSQTWLVSVRSSPDPCHSLPASPPGLGAQPPPQRSRKPQQLCCCGFPFIPHIAPGCSLRPPHSWSLATCKSTINIPLSLPQPCCLLGEDGNQICSRTRWHGRAEAARP